MRSVRPLNASDWQRVSEIYRQGIETGHATFELEVPSWDEWDRGHIEEPRLVVETGDIGVVAWAALSPVSRRAVYRGVAEHSIYVADEARGSGIGKMLLVTLVEKSEEAGFWTLQTAIFPENLPSIALHEAVGFRVIGVRERIGSHHGKWRDVVLMERRSDRVG